MLKVVQNETPLDHQFGCAKEHSAIFDENEDLVDVLKKCFIIDY